MHGQGQCPRRACILCLAERPVWLHRHRRPELSLPLPGASPRKHRSPGPAAADFSSSTRQFLCKCCLTVNTVCGGGEGGNKYSGNSKMTQGKDKVNLGSSIHPPHPALPPKAHAKQIPQHGDNMQRTAVEGHPHNTIMHKCPWTHSDKWQRVLHFK